MKPYIPAKLRKPASKITRKDLKTSIKGALKPVEDSKPLEELIKPAPVADPIKDKSMQELLDERNDLHFPAHYTETSNEEFIELPKKLAYIIPPILFFGGIWTGYYLTQIFSL